MFSIIISYKKLKLLYLRQIKRTQQAAILIYELSIFGQIFSLKVGSQSRFIPTTGLH